MIFKIGDRVRISYKGKSIDGEIFLSCSTGLSITLTFNGWLETYAGLMPVLWVDEGYIDLVYGHSVNIERLGKVIPWPQTSKRTVITQ